MNSLNSHKITLRSSTQTIDRWLEENPGMVTIKACGHPNASPKANNIIAQRLCAILEKEPDNWYHALGAKQLLDPSGPSAATIKHANRSRLIVTLVAF